MFTLSPGDTIEMLGVSSGNWATGLRRIVNEPDGIDAVIKLRARLEALLETTDTAMTTLILKEGDDANADLTNWAARVDSCRRMFDILDKNIPFAGKRQWNDDEVSEAFGFVKAVCEGAKLTLWHNGIDLDHGTEKKQPATV